MHTLRLLGTAPAKPETCCCWCAIAHQNLLKLGPGTYEVSTRVPDVLRMMQLSLPVKWRWRGHQVGGGAGHPIAAWPLVPLQEALEASPPPAHHIYQHK